MAALGEAVVEVRASMEKLDRDLAGAKGMVSKALAGVESGMKAVGAVALGGAVAGILAIGAGLAVAFKEATAAQDIMAQTEAVIKSTGGAAGMSAKAIADLATSLSTQSRFSDDAIQTGENLLLTFRNIGKDVFPMATQAMVDMATAMGTDVSGGAIQLGKALNDPVAGISALSRVGVTFSEDQKKVIAALVETGDVAGAQKIIIAELNAEFGGSAAAAAETFAGKMDVLKNKLLNVAEGIGLQLLPVMTNFMDNVIAPAIPVIEKIAGVFGDFLSTLASGDFSDPIGKLATLFSDVANAMGLDGGGVYGAVIKLREPFDTLVAFIQTNVPTAMADGQKAFDDTVIAIQPLIDAAGNVAKAFQESMPMISKTVQEMASFVMAQMAMLSPQLISDTSNTLDQVATFWRNHGETIMAVVGTAWKFVTVTVGVALVLLSGIVSNGMNIINGDWGKVWGQITATQETAMNMILSIAGTNLTEFNAQWSSNWQQAQLIVSLIWGQMQAAVTAKVNAMTGNIQAAIIDSVNWIRQYVPQFIVVGRNMIDGLAQGVRDAVGGLIASVVGAVQGALAAARGALQSHSPSLVFEGLGENMMQGLALGIAKNADLARFAMSGALLPVMGIVGADGGGERSMHYNPVTTIHMGPQDPMRTLRAARHLDKLGSMA